MDEIVGSSDSEMFVRSTYDMVYMTSATGIIRSQRRCVIGPVGAWIAYQPPGGTSAIKRSDLLTRGRRKVTQGYALLVE
jgi:hypothetical protein